MQRHIGALALAIMAVCTLLLPFMMSESPSNKVAEPSASILLSPEEMVPLKGELRELLDFVRPHLAEREGIVVTKTEILDAVRRQFEKYGAEEAFPEMQTIVRAQIDATKAVYSGEMSPREAAEHFMRAAMSPPEDTVSEGDIALWAQTLQRDATEARIAEMERMVPVDYEDSIEKSSGGYEKSLLNRKLAERFLPPDESAPSNGGWNPELDLYMLKYAKRELVGKHPSIPDAAAAEKLLQLPQFTALGP